MLPAVRVRWPALNSEKFSGASRTTFPPRYASVASVWRRNCRLLSSANLHQVVVERGAAADVGEGLGCRLIRIGTVVGQLSPPDGRRDHDAGTHAIGDHGRGAEPSP